MEADATLNLSIPVQKPVPEGHFLGNPIQVNAWLSELPMASIGELSRQVFKTLVEFNQLEVPASSRMQITRLFEQPIQYIVGNLRRYNFDLPFPLSEKSRKAALLSREFYSELAVSYKTSIQTATDGQNKTDPKLLAVAIYKALTSLLHVLQQSSMLYEPCPQNIWWEVHRLYAYAESQQLHRVRIQHTKTPKSTSTIGNIYKQALLFSVISPYSLRHREIEHIIQHLPGWSQLIALLRHPRKDEGDTHCLFISNLEKNTPPIHAELYAKMLSANCRFLDTSDLVTYLQKKLQQKPATAVGEDIAGSKEQDNHESLFHHMIHACSEAMIRKYIRTKSNAESKIIVGLHTVHAHITANIPENPTPEENASSSDPATDWPDQLDTISNYAYKEALAASMGHKFSLNSGEDFVIEETVIGDDKPTDNIDDKNYVFPWINNKSAAETKTHRCHLVDESAGGYWISVDGKNKPHIKVGEIIGMLGSSGKKSITVCISRWLKNNPSSGLQLGLKILSSKATAVSVQSEKPLRNAAHQHHGLLLSDTMPSNDRAELILSAQQFQIGDIVKVSAQNKSMRAKLTELIETLGDTSQFGFSVIGSEFLTKDTDKNTAEDDFDNLWSML